MVEHIQLVNHYERYNCAWECGQLYNQHWQAVNRGMAPPEIQQRLEGREYSADVAREMLEAGVTYWSHPGWQKDVLEALRRWQNTNTLIKVRLISEWLLGTLPTEVPVNEKLLNRLVAISDGDWTEAFPRSKCSWPRNTEYYASRGMLRLARIAADYRMQMGVEADMVLRAKRQEGISVGDYLKAGRFTPAVSRDI